MATYVIGDVHGCFKTFKAVLDRIDFRSGQDHLWFVGDLVNRGPRSLEMLRWAKEHSQEITLVLGNHDLHFLGRHFGVARRTSGDTLEELLEASDVKELAHWTATQPFLHIEGDFILVHAGILPAWNLEMVTRLAHRAELLLRERNLRFLRRRWKDNDTPFGIPPSPAWAARVFTHLRCCKSAHQPCYEYSGPPDSAPPPCTPWYEYPGIRSLAQTFLFGHWAQLGFYRNANAICVDSGCVYGGHLNALRLDDGSVYQISCQE